MARYFAGNTLAAFFRTSISAVETTAAGYDSAFVPNSIKVNNAGYIETYAFSATGTVWTHWEWAGDAAPSNSWEMARWVNGTTSIMRIFTTDSAGTTEPQYWNGSAWVTAGASFNQTSLRDRFDLKIILNTSFALYKGGTLVSSGSITGETTMTNVRLMSNFQSGANYAYYSQVMVADFDTRDSRYMMALMDGNSAANTGGTGTYTDVSETVLDEGTAEFVSVAGNKMGQTYANITVPDGYMIGAACLSARGRIDGAITDGKLGFRSGGANSSGSAKTYNTGYEPRGRIDGTDPNGGIPWTQTTFNALETYIEAV